MRLSSHTLRRKAASTTCCTAIYGKVSPARAARRPHCGERRPSIARTRHKDDAVLVDHLRSQVNDAAPVFSMQLGFGAVSSSAHINSGSRCHQTPMRCTSTGIWQQLLETMGDDLHVVPAPYSQGSLVWCGCRLAIRHVDDMRFVLQHCDQCTPAWQHETATHVITVSRKMLQSVMHAASHDKNAMHNRIHTLLQLLMSAAATTLHKLHRCTVAAAIMQTCNMLHVSSREPCPCLHGAKARVTDFAADDLGT